VRRLLLVAGDAGRGARLGQALFQEGFAVKVAPEGWYALTMLEREPTAVVLLDGAAGEPPAAELAAIVRADRDLAAVRLAVAVRPAEPAPDGFDVVIDGGRSAAELAAELRRRAADPTPAEARVLGGSLDALDLLHLVETLGRCRRTGRLSVCCPGDRVGEIYFDQGRLVHARCGTLTGRRAVGELLAAAGRQAEIPFELEALSREEVFRYPRTVRAEIRDLLLALAPAHDGRRAAGGHDGRGPR
jgi:hypothetical protein